MTPNNETNDARLVLLSHETRAETEERHMVERCIAQVAGMGPCRAGAADQHVMSAQLRSLWVMPNKLSQQRYKQLCT